MMMQTLVDKRHAGVVKKAEIFADENKRIAAAGKHPEQVDLQTTFNEDRCLESDQEIHRPEPACNATTEMNQQGHKKVIEQDLEMVAPGHLRHSLVTE